MTQLPKQARVPGKLLISTLLILFLASATWHLAGPELLYSLAQRASRQPDPVRTLALYDRLIQYFPRSHRAPEALYWSAQLLPGGDDFAAYFFPGASGWRESSMGTAELSASIAGREQRLRRLLEEYPESRPSRWHVPYVLGQDLLATGNIEEGTTLLEKAITDVESHQVVPAARVLYRYYLSTGQPREAIAVLDAALCRDTGGQKPELLLAKGEAHLALAEYSTAEAAFNEVLTAFDQMLFPKQEQRERSAPGEPPAHEIELRADLERRVQHQLARLEAARSTNPSQTAGTISGRVLLGGVERTSSSTTIDPEQGFEVSCSSPDLSGYKLL